MHKCLNKRPVLRSVSKPSFSQNKIVSSITDLSCGENDPQDDKEKNTNSSIDFNDDLNKVNQSRHKRMEAWSFDDNTESFFDCNRLAKEPATTKLNRNDILKRDEQNHWHRERRHQEKMEERRAIRLAVERASSAIVANLTSKKKCGDNND